MKECIICNKIKSEFPVRSNGRLRGECRQCTSRIAREYREENAEKIRLQAASNTYNISIEEAFELYSIKECGICNRNIIKNKNKCIDHCHATGKVRGVLCTQCNTGLGMFKDSEEFLSNAIKWLL
tara:strand:- start:40 stop:414 length:375 start_codon:yes stop_codon:yes gene_type:complete